MWLISSLEWKTLLYSPSSVCGRPEDDNDVKFMGDIETYVNAKRDVDEILAGAVKASGRQANGGMRLGF